MTQYFIPCTDGCELVEAYPDTNFDGGSQAWGGAYHATRIGMTTKEDECSAVLHFDFSEVSATPTSAYLYFYITVSGSSDSISPDGTAWQISRCLRSDYNSDDWVTDEATWNIYKTGSNWNTAGCHGIATDYTETHAVTPFGPATAFTLWAVDVTDMVGDAYGEDKILNIVINGAKTLLGESDYCYFQFANYKSDMPPLLVVCTGGDAQPSYFADKVDASADDADEKEDDGTMTTNGTEVRCIASTTESSRYWAGFRFHNGSFPSNGSTIKRATLVVQADSTATDDANLDVYGQDAAGGATFTSDAGDITDRTLTTASVEWVEDSLGTVIGGPWQSPGDLSTIIQELVTDYTLTSIVIIFQPKTDTNRTFWIHAYDQGAAYSAKLVVFWNEPAAGGDIIKISGVLWSDVKKVSGVAEASIKKVSGITAN